MRRSCPLCGLEFERSAAGSPAACGHQHRRDAAEDRHRLLAGARRNPNIPLGPLLLGLAAFAIVFPIAFYRSSRGLWASFLYLTGDNAEPDQRGRARE